MPARHHQPETSNLGALLMSLLGVGLLITYYVLHRMQHDNEESSFKTLSLSVGVVFLGLGLYFGIKNHLAARRWKAIPAHWLQASARKVVFHHAHDNYTLPGQIHAEWTDPAGQVRAIYSPEIGYNPEPFLPENLQVRYNPDDPSQARLDLSFLPEKILFLSWPSLIAQTPALRKTLLEEAMPFEAAFSGFKLMASPDDGAYEQCMAVCQWTHPQTGALHVMEAQVITNEKAPFPDWKPGQTFRGVVRMDAPSMYWIEM